MVSALKTILKGETTRGQYIQSCFLYAKLRKANLSFVGGAESAWN